jgi:hypothetical protein
MSKLHFRHHLQSHFCIPRIHWCHHQQHHRSVGSSNQLFIIPFQSSKITLLLSQFCFPISHSIFFFMILKILLCRKLFLKVLSHKCRVYVVAFSQLWTNTCKYIHTYASTHVYTNTHAHLNTHTHKSTYTHVQTHTQT